jgi:hypothetical protein
LKVDFPPKPPALYAGRFDNSPEKITRIWQFQPMEFAKNSDLALKKDNLGSQIAWHAACDK